MFIASALLLLIIGRTVADPEVLRSISIARVVSFGLVIGLNYIQYRSKRWKAAPLLVLMTVFSLMSLIYLYFIFNLTNG